MDYECQSVPFDKTLVSTDGVVGPLCNKCLAPDCTNPIKDFYVSIYGIQTKIRLWSINNVVRQVISCDGYVSEELI